MDDELELLLREHYGRAAQTIQPDPGLADRLRSTARPRRRLRLGRPALAAAVVVVGGLVWAEFGGSGDHATPAAVLAQPTVITISGTPIFGPGSQEEVTGSISPAGTVGLSVEFRQSPGWGTGPTVTAVAGTYRLRLSVPGDATALRVCTQAAPITCSPPLRLTRPAPSPVVRSSAPPRSTPSAQS